MKQIANYLASGRFLQLFTRSSDVILAGFVVIIIGMIIVPVPPTVIDMMIGVNMSVSICLLMVSLYIQKAVHLSIFPSILLFTTLFRLGIEIAATRQILLHADAGEIIEAFGNFVVGGNFIVGGVIFLIITIVQFIVVTKGAERVAEVAARFTLDAMPGKQMSIDADLRSGILDANQARDMRLALQKESQLYGAMDGAMKFVKGDVIAGIVIAVINIIGGLVIGMLTHKMSALQSAKVYSLLSIGEGLVTQIPSLMISLTAGIVTTRVSSENKKGNLGHDISTQIFSHSKGLILASFVTLGLSLLKGFPSWIFWILTGIFAFFGIKNYIQEKKGQETVQNEDGSQSIGPGLDDHSIVGGKSNEYTLTLPVILELGSMLSAKLKKEQGSKKLIEEMIPKMRHALYLDLGIRFPPVHIRTNSSNLGENDYAILLHEVPIVKGRIFPNAVLTNGDKQLLKQHNIPFMEGEKRIGTSSLWVSNEYKSILKQSNIQFWTPFEVLTLHLSYFYKKHGAEFLGIQEVRVILEFVEKSFPDLVKEVSRLIPLQKLTEIFRRLIQEEISIKDLRTILEALSEWAQTEKDTVLLTEYVRSSLKRYVSYKYSLGRSILYAYILDPEIEDMLRGAIKQTSAGSYLALDPDSVQLILHAMRKVITPTPPSGQPPVLITAIDVRRFARKLIESEFPDLPVVSYQEIVPDIRLQPLGRVQLR